jgi:hypothetical protein
MDTTLIGAIIGALATIIAALVTALIGLRASVSRNREELETLLHAAIVIGRRVSIAEEPQERAFLKDNLERLVEAGAETTSGLKRAEITVYPGEQNLAFVVQKDNPRPAFNVLTKITNDGQQVGIVDGLEAILTGPEGVSFRFVWNLFYGYQRGGLLHTMSSYIHPIAVSPGSSNLLGIQFIGPDLGIAKLYSWPTGRYQVEMAGWVNRSPERQPTNFSSKFYIDISSRDIAQLKEWIGWDDAAWAQFPHPDYPDPDKAAGHLVRIVPG